VPNRQLRQFLAIVLNEDDAERVSGVDSGIRKNGTRVGVLTSSTRRAETRRTVASNQDHRRNDQEQ